MVIPSTYEEAVEELASYILANPIILAKPSASSKNGQLFKRRKMWDMWDLNTKSKLMTHMNLRFNLTHPDDAWDLIVDGTRAKIAGKPFDAFSEAHKYLSYWEQLP